MKKGKDNRYVPVRDQFNIVIGNMNEQLEIQLASDTYDMLNNALFNEQRTQLRWGIAFVIGDQINKEIGGDGPRYV